MRLCSCASQCHKLLGAVTKIKGKKDRVAFANSCISALVRKWPSFTVGGVQPARKVSEDKLPSAAFVRHDRR
jgi:hypothetical protein